jgi:hypothetical protein
MIVFDLHCRAGGHRFEGWFGSSDDYARQQERGLVSCPECGSADVIKAPMAPNVARKGNQLTPVSAPTAPAPAPTAGASRAMAKGAMPPEAVKMMQAMAAMQAEALKTSRWVGGSFAEDARAMHYGEREVEPIHGEATLREAEELWEEGIEVAPLPFPVAPPREAN